MDIFSTSLFSSSISSQPDSTKNQAEDINEKTKLIKALQIELKEEQVKLISLLEEQSELTNQLYEIGKGAKNSAEKIQSLTNLLEKYNSDISCSLSGWHNNGLDLTRGLSKSPRCIEIEENTRSTQSAMRQDCSWKSINGETVPIKRTFPPNVEANKKRNLAANSFEELKVNQFQNVLKGINSTRIANFNRKTRNLLLYDGENRNFQSTAIISTLDGDMAIIDLSTGSRQTISSRTFDFNWVESMEWISNSTIALCSNKITKNNGQVLLLYNCNVDDNNFNYKAKLLSNTPHTKSIKFFKKV
jgi:hypothetical protein